MRRCFALLCAAWMLLSGCAPVSREPDNLALVRVLGVDGGGPVTLTAVCGSDSQRNVSQGSASGDDFEQARKQLPWSGQREELSLTGVSYLLIGADVDLEAVLFSVLEDADLGATASVWLVEAGASGVLASCEDPAADLELLTLQGVKAPSVAQALAALSTEGEVILPCLAEQGGQLKERGTIRWKKSG